MSIAYELERIRTAKQAIKDAINAKGGTLTDELIDKYAEAIAALPSSGGMDLSFITATAGDILSGKVGADAEGNPVVGSIPMRESMTLTPGTSWKNIPAGTYLAGDQYIAGDENLIPENIADGVSIFNVQGTHKGGSSMDFYKCASVDTENKTWSGYKAVLTDGVYTFEESITAGLSYTAVTPVIDRVYTADALCEIKTLYNGIPVDGLAFYAPLTKASSVAETGQALIARNVTYETVDGIPCAYFDGNATIYVPDNDENILRLPRGNMPGTISLWFKSTAARYASIMNYCGENRTARGVWLNDSGNITLDDGGGNLSDTVGFCDDVNHFNGNWCHALITYNGTTLKLYIDGIEKSSVDYELNTGAMRFGIGAWAWGHITHYYTGYVAAVRVYDRVVTAGEIQQLAGEFDV